VNAVVLASTAGQRKGFHNQDKEILAGRSLFLLLCPPPTGVLPPVCTCRQYGPAVGRVKFKGLHVEE
jgi:hypothetical protein